VATTTIRVDTETHAKLLELGSSSGSSLMDTVRDAAEALRRQRFAQQVTGQLDGLHENPSAWAEYLAAAESTTVADGVR
jgi:Tfp pilus assembly protein PilV